MTDVSAAVRSFQRGAWCVLPVWRQGGRSKRNGNRAGAYGSEEYFSESSQGNVGLRSLKGGETMEYIKTAAGSNLLSQKRPVETDTEAERLISMVIFLILLGGCICFSTVCY